MAVGNSWNAFFRAPQGAPTNIAEGSPCDLGGPGRVDAAALSLSHSTGLPAASPRAGIARLKQFVLGCSGAVRGLGDSGNSEQNSV